ncbi:MAG: hypothetical protein HZB55_16535 [Deltaproteobacteria bacterium]|nr:hypothetical protein [Deltaproteobacteria bacterium]
MLGLLRFGTDGRGGRSLHRAGLSFVMALALALPARAAIINSKHDFVNDGFTGGGACAACHVPHNANTAAGYLYPRPGNTVDFSTAPARLCMDCHKWPAPTTAPTPPANAGFPATWPVGHEPPNPTAKHALASGYAECGRCHKHKDSFKPDTNPCLDCHQVVAGFTWSGGEVANYDDGYDPEVAKFFADLGGARGATPPTIRSQHNLRYNPAGDLRTAAENECRKCHGLQHPNDTVFLVDARKVAYSKESTTTGDFSAYEPLCLSCHDGVATTTPSDQRFNVAGYTIPANQVAPTSVTNPAVLQASAPWVVPAVPPWSPLPTPAVPYFANYKLNGHGAPLSLISGGQMAKTCLAGGPQEGCHTAHGSTSRFLLAQGPFSADLVTASQVAVGVCYGCHPVADLSTTLMASRFHAWMGDNTVLHDDGRHGDTAGDGVAPWSAYGVANMNITAARTPSAVLPFYGDPAVSPGNEIHRRTYLTTPLTTNHWLHCLTCHDPHGTGPITEPGMLRLFDSVMDYTSPLCGQCHVK